MPSCGIITAAAARTHARMQAARGAPSDLEHPGGPQSSASAADSAVGAQLAAGNPLRLQLLEMLGKGGHQCAAVHSERARRTCTATACMPVACKCLCIPPAMGPPAPMPHLPTYLRNGCGGAAGPTGSADGRWLPSYSLARSATGTCTCPCLPACLARCPAGAYGAVYRGVYQVCGVRGPACLPACLPGRPTVCCAASAGCLLLLLWAPEAGPACRCVVPGPSALMAVPLQLSASGSCL